jgi:hypothetical protein
MLVALALSYAAVADGRHDDTSVTRMESSDRSMQGTVSQESDFVARLEAAYGGPSQAGFGSAVFHKNLPDSKDLPQAALSVYRTFVGALWERYGEQAWMVPWREVYARKPGTEPDVIAELRGIADRDAQRSVPIILDNIEGAEAARAALANAFDDPAVTELRVFNLGDGEAMSGLLVAGRRGASGEVAFAAFLLD